MEGRKLLEELKRTVNALQLFSEIGKTLTSTLDIKEVLRTVLEKVSELLEPTSWSLLLMDSKIEKLCYEILINEPSIDRTETIAIGQGIVGWVAQEGTPVLHPAPKDRPQFALNSKLKIPKGIQTLLCVPLRSKGSTLGVIELVRKGDGANPFSEEDLRTLAVIADYAAIAIENARNFQKVQELTITDDLTTLFNVRHLHTLLDTEIRRSNRYQKQFSMIFLDLDRFKQVNDTYGHIHGSQLLKETAQIIEDNIRSVDYAARYGGDEFVVLLPETNKKEAVMIAERIRHAIESNVFLKERGVNARFTASFGVATFPDDAQSKDELIRMADEAMYEVKDTTRNRVSSA